MAGWSLSEQARDALRTARALAHERGNAAPGSANGMTSTPAAPRYCAPAA
jgi:hypothetical protein